MGYRVSFGLRLLAVAAIVGLVVWGASAAEVAAPKGLKTAFGALTGGSTAAKAATPTTAPTAATTAAPTASTSTTATGATTAAGATTGTTAAGTTTTGTTTAPFMATLTNTCVPDPSLPKTYYAGKNCADPDLRFNKYLLTMSTEIYKVVGYQPKMVQLGQETCGELATYDQTRVVMDVTQWLVAEQAPANPRKAALSVLNAATKNLCPELRSKVTIA